MPKGSQDKRASAETKPGRAKVKLGLKRETLRELTVTPTAAERARGGVVRKGWSGQNVCGD